MNRINKLLDSGKTDLLTLYYTAGYPGIGDTMPILKALEETGADIVEIGVPYSDPIADGPVIQESNMHALGNGISIPLLFDQLDSMRESVSVPVILMGYFNPMLQYGMEKFCQACRNVGVDGLIIPDLTPELYQSKYRELFDRFNLSLIFLITPSTNGDRIRKVDELSTSFIYMVSSAAITGDALSVDDAKQAYFERIKNMNLKHPCQVGFGLSNREQVEGAWKHARGAIIGSAFIRALGAGPDPVENTRKFMASIR